MPRNPEKQMGITAVKMHQLHEKIIGSVILTEEMFSISISYYLISYFY